MRALFEFELPEIHGFVRPSGHYHGLVITHDNQERIITRPGRCFLNLEHYEAFGKQGLFVPRDECKHSYHLFEDGIEITFSETKEWKLNSRILYSFRPPDTVNVEFRFQFEKDYQSFEAFIASYMPINTQPPLIKMDGEWHQPVINTDSKEQLFIPWKEEARKTISDGRWNVLFERGYSYRITEQNYQIPLMVTKLDQDPERPWLIQMIEAGKCLALSPNLFAPAHDFSLYGEDVQKGQEVVCFVRMIYRKMNNLTQVEQEYRNFCKDFEKLWKREIL